MTTKAIYYMPIVYENKNSLVHSKNKPVVIGIIVHDPSHAQSKFYLWKSIQKLNQGESFFQPSIEESDIEFLKELFNYPNHKPTQISFKNIQNPNFLKRRRFSFSNYYHFAEPNKITTNPNNTLSDINQQLQKQLK